MGLHVAIVGATGAVGRTLLKVMEERNFPCQSVKLLASARSAGKTFSFRDGELEVQEASAAAFKGVDVAFFCASGELSKSLGPEAVRHGAVVIDNSSAFRMDPTVPLVVPEINSHAIFKHQGIIANPNCSTIIMSVALKPIYDTAGIKRVVVSTYQSASGAGVEAVEEVKNQTQAFLDGREMVARILPSSSDRRHYPLAFNVIPQVDLFQDDGYTREESKMIHETRKIFGDENLQISPTTVRVPVLWCHSEALNVETCKPLSPEQAKALLRDAEGVILQDDIQNQEYPMPYTVGERDEVFVGRVRNDPSQPNTLNMWVVGNQLRKGAASNAVQIAEKLFAPR